MHVMVYGRLVFSPIRLTQLSTTKKKQYSFSHLVIFFQTRPEIRKLGSKELRSKDYSESTKLITSKYGKFGHEHVWGIGQDRPAVGGRSALLRASVGKLEKLE